MTNLFAYTEQFRGDDPPDDDLHFSMRCPVCGESVLAFQDGDEWRIEAHYPRSWGADGCPGSATEVKQWRRT